MNWKSYPYLVPMRHVRPHVGYVTEFLAFFTGNSTVIGAACVQLCRIVDLVETGITYTVGLVWHVQEKVFKMVPEDLHIITPQVWILAKKVAAEVLRADFHGIMYGAGVKRTGSLPISSVATLFTWHSKDITAYRMHTVNPQATHALGTKESSSIIFCRYVGEAEEADKKKVNSGGDNNPWSFDLTSPKYLGSRLIMIMTQMIKRWGYFFLHLYRRLLLQLQSQYLPRYRHR